MGSNSPDCIDVRDHRAGDAVCVRESDVALVVVDPRGAGEFPSNRYPALSFSMSVIFALGPLVSVARKHRFAFLRIMLGDSRRPKAAPIEERQNVVMRRSCLALLLACACGEAASALDREQQHGKELLDTLCARCHAVGKTGRSPHIDAPVFRSFGDKKLYDEDFTQRLQNGLSTIHPDMPTFRFNRSDAEAAVNYLKTIQERSKPK